MEIFYKGKTKDLYKNDQGDLVFKFKDDITGTDGKEDTGGDEVVGSIEGQGSKNLRMSKYYFEKLKDRDIPSHYIDSNLEENTMTIKEASVFGHGLEVITRYVAVGSFVRRYGLYVEEGQALDEYVEFTLKDDDRQDPLITKQGLLMLGILTEDQYQDILDLNKRVLEVLQEDLESKGLELYDIKLEYGLIDGQVGLIDELSAGNMRVYHNGQKVGLEELIALVLD